MQGSAVILCALMLLCGWMGAARATTTDLLDDKTSSSSTAQVKQQIIGDRVIRIYHLPDMKSYDTIVPSPRVEFNSASEAMIAGYHKAPR